MLEYHGPSSSEERTTLSQYPVICLQGLKKPISAVGHQAEIRTGNLQNEKREFQSLDHEKLRRDETKWLYLAPKKGTENKVWWSPAAVTSTTSWK
jgi:hypothetical protein